NEVSGSGLALSLCYKKCSLPMSATDSCALQIAQIVACTEAEGPGRRFALWFQGCPLRCPGCCNPEMLPFAGGRLVPPAEVVAQLRQVDVEGITLLGGEPMAHPTGAAALARAAHELGLSVMVFSGYTLEEIHALPDADAGELLAHTDILIDGPYLREVPELQRRWIGSSNQRIHFLTDRYRADDPCWQLPYTFEVRLRDGEIFVNGFPAQGLEGLWKRL